MRLPLGWDREIGHDFLATISLGASWRRLRYERSSPLSRIFLSGHFQDALSTVDRESHAITPQPSVQGYWTRHLCLVLFGLGIGENIEELLGGFPIERRDIRVWFAWKLHADGSSGVQGCRNTWKRGRVPQSVRSKQRFVMLESECSHAGGTLRKFVKQVEESTPPSTGVALRCHYA
jgi:hypothetical protein